MGGRCEYEVKEMTERTVEDRRVFSDKIEDLKEKLSHFDQVDNEQ